ncbi:hypothetical protein [Burkholderia vietnamiensis]|uniref:hypothetical protein n=1 Tax=Burkholderia vietnamiensis TaxID=60552 RepID=UPI0018C45D77|nr:hypothetical protein [Burkholderia vietnamiensis]MDN7928701.1 hypothetical protein [Burkholderia vietnamiensis]HDR9251168.1 hypothetical protein [Burkholderia vietnamiensis]
MEQWYRLTLHHLFCDSEHMEKVKIKLVTVGRLPLHLNLNTVSGWKSEVFELVGDVENYELRGDSDIEGWAFSDKLIKAQLPLKKNYSADFLIAIVNFPLEGNWYARPLGENQIVFTFFEIKESLNAENIPLANAILRVLYAYSLRYRRSGNTIPEIGAAQSFTHDDTRGCIFDMNGIKNDIVESCNNPIVCGECEARSKDERVPNQTIKAVQKEIRKIRKPLYYRSLDFAKTKPVIALVISSLFAISLGVTGSLIASYIYDFVKPHPGIGETRQVTDPGKPAQ